MNEVPLPPPRPSIRQRQKNANSHSTNSNSNSKDLPQDEIVNQNSRQATEPSISREQEKLDRELMEFNKSLISSNKRSQMDNVSKGALTLPLATEEKPEQICKRPYPKKVFFIIANEFCERFSYYGLRTVLVLYFKSVLGFTDSKSTVSFHLFTTICYVTPILGAILGDSVWGRFKTVFYLSIVYFIGEVILVLSSIFWDFGAFSEFATFLGLFIIGFGTGGIKPCVCALGGDQFLEHEVKWRESFFEIFYACINVGSLISMFATPMLRSDFQCVHRQDCYPLAFGLPCVLMFVAIVVFLMGKNQYNLVPLPEKNVIIAFCSCTWLALKRKLTGYKAPISLKQNGGAIDRCASDAASSSSLSVSSDESAFFGVGKVNQTNSYNDGKLATPAIRPIADEIIMAGTQKESQLQLQGAKRSSHWLYLASDRFDVKSIEDFRAVYGLFLLFAPVTIYWCLYDQQGSLWTLQAVRMDGRVFNTNFYLQPDQMSVANPLILLALIPIFRFFIYPALSSCNILTTPIQRMTAGGCLAAVAFVLSAMIEFGIQSYEPLAEPLAGRANVLLVNGLSECSLINPSISYVPQIPTVLNGSSEPEQYDKMFNGSTSTQKLNNLQPLSSQTQDIISSEANFLNNYRLKFKLASSGDLTNNNHSNLSMNIGCPFGSNAEYDVVFGPFADKSVKLVYLEQGNGKLTQKTFNESLALPPAGKARVRLIYEGFGSLANREKRQFYLLRQSVSDEKSSATQQLNFKIAAVDGQVTLSDHLDIDVASLGDIFLLRTNDNLLEANSYRISLKPGTRNLIVVHQKDNLNVDVRLQVLQDNTYRISILYQLAPYIMISISEVMFSITGLEFSYTMAPETMKSVILASWSLMAALGNVLIVAVESLHLFSNIGHDFLFYSAIMTVDMFLFALLGYYYRPYKTVANSNR